MPARTFTVGDLEEMDVPWNALASEVVSEHRWYTRRTAVFEHDGAFWQVEYMDPASELQEDQDLWDGGDAPDNVVKATQVEKRPVTVERWFPIADGFVVNPSDWRKLVVNTSRAGELYPFTYAELVRSFGPPITLPYGEDGKSDVEWVVRFPDGVIATIYNYKDGPAYLGAEGTQVDEITDWHVGHHPNHAGDDVVQRLGDVLADAGEKAGSS